MDIRVGGSPPIGGPGDNASTRTGGVEAKILAVRKPRRRAVGPPSKDSERREESADRDPLTGRVLVLLIPDGSRLPDGIESGEFRVFLRFARR